MRMSRPSAHAAASPRPWTHRRRVCVRVGPALALWLSVVVCANAMDCTPGSDNGDANATIMHIAYRGHDAGFGLHRANLSVPDKALANGTCTKILGSLKVSCAATTQLTVGGSHDGPIVNLAFLSGVTEITGFLWIENCASLTSLDGLSALRIIGGSTTMGLRVRNNTLIPNVKGFEELAAIRKGGVLFEKNANLCYIDTMPWRDIVTPNVSGARKSIRAVPVNHSCTLLQCDSDTCHCGYCGGPGVCHGQDRCKTHWTDPPSWAEENDGTMAAFVIVVVVGIIVGLFVAFVVQGCIRGKINLQMHWTMVLPPRLQPRLSNKRASFIEVNFKRSPSKSSVANKRSSLGADVDTAVTSDAGTDVSSTPAKALTRKERQEEKKKAKAAKREAQREAKEAKKANKKAAVNPLAVPDAPFDGDASLPPLKKGAPALAASVPNASTSTSPDAAKASGAAATSQPAAATAPDAKGEPIAKPPQSGGGAASSSDTPAANATSAAPDTTLLQANAAGGAGTDDTSPPLISVDATESASRPSSPAAAGGGGDDAGLAVPNKGDSRPTTAEINEAARKARGSIDLTAEDAAKLPKLTTRVKEVTIENAPPELHAQAESEFSPLRENLARLEAQVTKATTEADRLDALARLKSARQAIHSGLQVKRKNARQQIDDAGDDEALKHAGMSAMVIARLQLMFFQRMVSEFKTPVAIAEDGKEPAAPSPALPTSLSSTSSLPSISE